MLDQTNRQKRQKNWKLINPAQQEDKNNRSCFAQQPKKYCPIKNQSKQKLFQRSKQRFNSFTFENVSEEGRSIKNQQKKLKSKKSFPTSIHTNALEMNSNRFGINRKVIDCGVQTNKNLFDQGVGEYDCGEKYRRQDNNSYQHCYQRQDHHGRFTKRYSGQVMNSPMVINVKGLMEEMDKKINEREWVYCDLVGIKQIREEFDHFRINILAELQKQKQFMGEIIIQLIEGLSKKMNQQNSEKQNLCGHKYGGLVKLSNFSPKKQLLGRQMQQKDEMGNYCKNSQSVKNNLLKDNQQENSMGSIYSSSANNWYSAPKKQQSLKYDQNNEQNVAINTSKGYKDQNNNNNNSITLIESNDHEQRQFEIQNIRHSGQVHSDSNILHKTKQIRPFTERNQRSTVFVESESSNKQNQQSIIERNQRSTIERNHFQNMLVRKDTSELMNMNNEGVRHDKRPATTIMVPKRENKRGKELIDMEKFKKAIRKLKQDLKEIKYISDIKDISNKNAQNTNQSSNINTNSGAHSKTNKDSAHPTLQTKPISYQPISYYSPINLLKTGQQQQHQQVV